MAVKTHKSLSKYEIAGNNAGLHYSGVKPYADNIRGATHGITELT